MAEKTSCPIRLEEDQKLRAEREGKKERMISS